MSILSTKDRADLTHLIIEENGHKLRILEISVADNGKSSLFTVKMVTYYIYSRGYVKSISFCR